MAFFKFRKSGGAPEAAAPAGRKSSGKNAAAAEAETVDAMRRRARHRLIGAVVLVLAAVIGFPLVFDTQPRPVAVNAPIIIPDRNEAAPLAPPAAASRGEVVTGASLDSREQVVPAGEVPATKPVEQAPEKPAAKPAEKAADTARPSAPVTTPTATDDAAAARAERDAAQAREAEQARKEREAKAAEQAKARAERDAEQAARKKAEDAARAKALLEGRNPGKAAAKAAQQAHTAAAGGGRFVVQIGAYAESSGVSTARQKAQGAGVSTFTQDVNTKAGKRTRVRAGPFASREAAEQAAAKLKRAGLGASVIPL
ncbi:MAG: SPOR domain-containing protein [Burkholderiaceae bacterium]|uniref:SPOR domain-containing protein n=2 Tax=Ottowia sp. TaxID=1898956 RepID=UPI002B7999D1|nr:SPOR domain-containing protein [Ottowia sp.]MCP5257011.1 SPOR domain-containing protein [Burkholderiaceae bacterium]HRW71662.1 SPOR domain-containing protein [Ottowia sp.]